MIGNLTDKIICQKCKKEFLVESYRKNVAKFCSKVCSRKGAMRPSKIPIKKCLVCDKMFKTYPCKVKKGWGVYCSRKCAGSLLVGRKPANYLVNRSLLKKLNDTNKDRRSSAYNNWRKQVWLRDNFKCKIANPNCKGRLEAHHILSYTNYPDLRYDINNGITLCHAHHPRKREDEAKLSPYFKKLVAEMK